MRSAAIIAKALGGHRCGTGWIARCPAHDDHTPSLSISTRGDGKTLVHCFSGCEQSKVLAALRCLGLWGGRDDGHSHHHSRGQTRSVPENRAWEDVNRTAAALAIWRTATSPAGTLVETYLATRGLVLPPTTAIRFHPHLKHASGRAWPAMVALVTAGLDNRPLGVLRTYLDNDGSTKAPVSTQKMMLGPCRGGVVRLAAAGHELLIGEGVESTLSGMQATGISAWAALSTAGLRSLELPAGITDVVILADGDEAGEAAAQHCAHRLKGQSCRVRIARPPVGQDFNDLLLPIPTTQEV